MVEVQVDGPVQVKHWMPQLPQDRPSVDAVEQVVIVVGLIQEFPVVKEHILQPLSAFRFGRDAERLPFGW